MRLITFGPRPAGCCLSLKAGQRFLNVILLRPRDAKAFGAFCVITVSPEKAVENAIKPHPFTLVRVDPTDWGAK